MQGAGKPRLEVAIVYVDLDPRHLPPRANEFDHHRQWSIRYLISSGRCCKIERFVQESMTLTEMTDNLTA